MVPDAVAAELGIIQQPAKSVTDHIADTLAGRRILVVFDNCEHVLDAAADLIETILGRSSTVSVIATSREGLRVGAEHLWPVPSLDVRDGAASAAVELFIERARAVVPGFSVHDEVDVDAVTEICRRLDGIALAIELAAARMVSMTPTEVLARLNDRFRLLSGSRRGLERHQTLRQAVQWSYDLLSEDEQSVLAACAVFAGGFDTVSVTAVHGGFDEYTMLDLVDSLVRKSLLTATRTSGGTRFAMLETIRQFVEDQHATVGGLGELRDGHARYYANQVVAHWDLWDGPGYDAATEWVDVEFDNLRSGFRWATDRSRPRRRSCDRCAHHHARVLSAAVRADRLGRRAPPRGGRRRRHPATPPVHRGQLLRVHRSSGGCRRVCRGGGHVAGSDPATNPSPTDGPPSGWPLPTSTPGGPTGAWRSVPGSRPRPDSPASSVCAG